MRNHLRVGGAAAISAAEEAARAEFLLKHPEYGRTSHLDALRASDYSRLDASGQIYLDYTGGSLHGASQLREHADLLTQHVYSNPHSSNLTSAATTGLVERARHYVLQYFNAPANEYVAVFTVNATGALKQVGEAYPFAAGGRYLLTADNHNSVNGIREFARSKGAAIEYAPLTIPDLRIDTPRLDGLLDAADRTRPNLFAFPAQSNFSGVKHPLDLVERAQSKGWDVLLDAAAFVPTNRLDLATVRPEFVSISFYKMFGYPTGVGCLLVRSSALRKLARPWFAGGTVRFATVRGRAHVLAPGEAGFEDGTLNYLSIPAVEIGLRHLESIGLDAIQTRVRCLTSWLLERLLALQHANGRHMVRIYGPADVKMRGGTVALNLYDPDGHLLDYRRVEELASLERISLRTGCFCNPGASETAEGLTDEDTGAGVAVGADITLTRFLEVLRHRGGGKSVGAIRVSLGLMSNFADLYRFITFVEGLREQTRLTLGEATFDIDSCRVMRDGS
ncbi:MAG: aminotransferase class V-fold PLP-dependent enzyme [Acidobacteria bacterium]|nr:aminotransferase class V-fold PLP-dependent enzyme [Acidobacteriota bacterium]